MRRGTNPKYEHVYFVKRRPESPVVALLRGAEAVLVGGDYLTARAIFLQVLELDPHNSLGKVGLAEVRRLLSEECKRVDDAA